MDLPFLSPLPVATLRQAGIPEPWTFGYADRVRFAELDALGHVNHTGCLRWFENFRLSYLSDYGLSLYRPEDMQIVLRDIRVRYNAPLFLGETYIVTGRTLSFRSSSFVMGYSVWVGGEERVSCETVIVSLEQDGRTKRPLTPAMQAILVDRDGARDDRG